MDKRKLGNTGIEIAPLMLGGNVFGWTIDEQKSFTILDAFVDAGLNAIDTADVYSKWKPGNNGGESETIIGNWLHKSGKRDKVVIATKVGMEMAPDKKGLSKKYIIQAVEDSLKRLQTDHIDLYQSHKDDSDTPLEETAEAYMSLVKQGKIIAIGASNFSGGRLKAALDTGRQNNTITYETLQPEYNLYAREHYERELEPVCREAGIGVIPYYSLASGFLTGKYRSEADFNKSPRGQGMKKFMNERGMRIIKALDAAAAEYKAQPASIALAWLIARQSITAPIASATKPEQLHELVHATQLKLSEATIDALTKASNY